MKQGQRHFVNCRCFLRQDALKPGARSFSFVVFSVICDDRVEASYVECPNCGVVHRVYEIGRSEIANVEQSAAVQRLDDVKSALDSKIAQHLDRAGADVSAWQHALFIVEEKRWGEFVTLVRDVIDGKPVVKVLRILAPTLVKVETLADDR